MKALEKKHPLAIRWFHWVNFPVLSIMIWSGILIYWADGVYRIGWGGHTVVQLFPDKFYTPTFHGKPLYDLSQNLANGQAWHWAFMWVFAINGLLYVLYTAVSGEWRYLLPNRHSMKEAWQVVLHDLHLSKYHPPRRKFNGAQQFAYTSVILMGLGSLLTGFAIYKPAQLQWLVNLLGGYGRARVEHFALMVGYVGFFIVHIVQVARAGWNNFRAMITGYEVVTVEPAPEAVAVPGETR